MPRRLLYLILISTAIRMVTASVLELGNDEVYYFLYALDLQPNYFDHPPGVGVLIRISTANLLLTDEFFIRLGAIVCCAIGTWLSYQLGKELKNERTGWFAALLYTTSVYSSVIAGSFIIPDSPQVVFWMASLLVMHRILTQPTMGRWVWFGLLSGICILCKVHAVFLWGGLGLYVLLFKRDLLKAPGLYLSALLTLLVISPVLLWNIQNDFITYRFHSSRVEIRESLFHLDYFFQTLFGQLLYNNPINAIVIILAIVRLRTMSFLGQHAVRFVLLTGLPLILVVTVMSLFNSMLPHWSGPGFMTLSLLAAAYLDEKAPAESFGLPRLISGSCYLILTALFAAVLLINFFPGTIGSKDGRNYGEDDFTLDMYGWKQFSEKFSQWTAQEGALSKSAKIVSHKWFPAAHLDYYVSVPMGMTLVGVGEVADLHQYYWLNKNRPTLEKGDSALCIVPSNYPVELSETFLMHFDSSDSLTTISTERMGKRVRDFDIYLLRGYRKTDEAHLR